MTVDTQTTLGRLGVWSAEIRGGNNTTFTLYDPSNTPLPAVE